MTSSRRVARTVFFNIPKFGGSLREHVAACEYDRLTLNHRLERIETLLGAKLDEASWIAKLHVAVRLRQQTLPDPGQG